MDKPMWINKITVTDGLRIAHPSGYEIRQDLWDTRYSVLVGSDEDSVIGQYDSLSEAIIAVEARSAKG